VSQANVSFTCQSGDWANKACSARFAMS
jgi:hypothetical protein